MSCHAFQLWPTLGSTPSNSCLTPARSSLRAEIGEGLRASGVPRNEVFVTTKIWPSHFAPQELIRAAKESLVKLRMSDVDLLLLHWPNPQVPLSETLGALCKVKQDGMARHIGVSNFNTALLDEATALASEPLVCNQVEMHPFLDQSRLVTACRDKGMAVVAYSPIARGSAKNDAVLARIGKAHGKTAAQVCLRYLVQQSIVVIPRTSKVERLEENMSIFDFALTDTEMSEIASLARRDGRIVDWSPATLTSAGCFLSSKWKRRCTSTGQVTS